MLIGQNDKWKIGILYMFFLIIMQESKLIHMIFFLLEKTSTLHHVIILIKSVSNKNQNQYYYNIDLK